MIHIYTGNGKGKTTAALGQAMRAVGHGLKVLMIQFMKGEVNYGELEAAKKLSNFRIEQFGRPDFVNPEHPDEMDIRFAKAALTRAAEAVNGRQYDIIILDEINVAVNFGLIETKDVILLFKQKPEDVVLILTGRYMPEEFVPFADLITECREVKHYFNKGAKAREGFEY